MTQPDRSASEKRRTIMTLAGPIVLGMLSQNVMNLADTAMVGQLGETALAAVGMSGFLLFALSAALTQLSTGVQSTTAKLYGAKEWRQIARPLHVGLTLGLLGSIPIACFVMWKADIVLSFMIDDGAVQKLGGAYIQIRAWAIPAVVLNFCFRGYWNAINLSHFYMRTLITMHVVNIVVSSVLIFGIGPFPKLGVEGAALGTTLSLWVGVFSYIALGLRHTQHYAFLTKKFPISPGKAPLEISFWGEGNFRNVLVTSIPSGIQQSFFAFGLSTLFMIIGMVGTTEVASAQVVINIMLVSILPGIALGIAGMSLVGQSIGRQNLDEAYMWGNEVVKVSLMALLGVGVLIVLGAPFILRIFTQEESVLETALLPLRLTLFVLAGDAIGVVLLSALIPVGFQTHVAIASILTQWALAIPIQYVGVKTFGWGLNEVWVTQIIYRLVSASIMAMLWHGQRWRASALQR